jgi:hypothetical protein
VPATTERAAPEHANTPSVTIEEPKGSTASAASDRVAGDDPKVMATVSMKQPETLAELIATMQDFEFDLSDPDLLYNQLDKLDEAAAKMVVGYLLASLRMHKDHATGEPEITRAMQFLTGNRKLSTSAAYDAIKRLMKRNSTVLEAAMHEPLLKKAYDQAEANRPTNRKKMSNSTDE